jgi:hypothetical protein
VPITPCASQEAMKSRYIEEQIVRIPHSRPAKTRRNTPMFVTAQIQLQL